MSAKDALVALGTVAKSCDVKDPNRGYVLAAERITRYAVVLFIVNRGGEIADGSRHAFEEAAEKVFGQAAYDRELRAKLLLAYHKLCRHRGDIWRGGRERIAGARGGRCRRERIAGGG